jgi:ABC-type lipoprotein export system ATPase subunit
MLYEIKNLQCTYDKQYVDGESKIVLKIEHLVIPRGKKIFIVGESGIGKSTILEVLGMMNNTIIPDSKTKFHFYQEGNHSTDLLAMWNNNNDDELSDFRRKHFNFIFQSTNLMRNFTAYENISITRMLQGYSQEEAFAKAHQVIKDLGLEEHVNETTMAHNLSGGQQQRLAFARAIIPDFTVLFGDEPTGNLDADNARKTMELLSNKLNEMQGSSAIIVSHDMRLSMDFADVIIKIKKREMKITRRVNDIEYTEIIFYGLITDESVYVPTDSTRKAWTNTIDEYTDVEFEQFLKRG